MRRLRGHLVVASLVALAACGATGPREGDRERELGAIAPQLDERAIERVGGDAGEDLRKSLGVLVEPVATDRLVVTGLPRDLSEIDEGRLFASFIEGARIRTRPGAAEISSTSLVARVSALVRRKEEGTVAIDYLFSFLLRRGEDIPWAHVVVASAHGARGALEPTAIGQDNLAALAETCAKDVARMLEERRKATAVLVPVHGVDETAGVILGFEDHLRGALLRQGVRLAVGEGLPRIQSEISLESRDPIAGSESHRFVVELFEARADFPWSRWEKQTTVTGGRTR